MKGKNIRVGRWYIIDRSIRNNDKKVTGKILGVLPNGYWKVETSYGSQVICLSGDFISQIRDWNDSERSWRLKYKSRS